MTDMRYGNTRVAKIKAAYDDLRAAVRAGDMEKAEAALDRYEQWADYVFAPPPQDRFIEAADALAGECNRIAPVIGEALDALGMGDPHGVATSNKFRKTLTEYRAAREAITRGTPPAFATSA